MTGAKHEICPDNGRTVCELMVPISYCSADHDKNYTEYLKKFRRMSAASLPGGVPHPKTILTNILDVVDLIP